MTATSINKKRQQQQQKSISKDELYLITFKGLYRARSGDQDKPFEIQMKMRDSHVAQNPLSMFKRHGLHLMNDKYPDFAGLVKFWLVEAVNETNPSAPITNIRIMNRNQLIQFAQDQELDIVFGLYPDDESLRTAIEESMDDPDGFYANQDMLYAKRGPQMEDKDDLLALNNLRPNQNQPAKLPPVDAPQKPQHNQHQAQPQNKKGTLDGV